MTFIDIAAHRNGIRARDLALLDLLHLQQLGLAPGGVSVQQLRQLWGLSQSQVSRRMAAIAELGVYRVRPGWGHYLVLEPGVPANRAERWEAVRRQLQEAARQSA